MSKKKKENEEISETKKVEPIVYINTPISNLKEDIVGFETQVATVENAINSGATMIGLIADYGTGKSSVTDIICKKLVEPPYKYPMPIKINMWDCLKQERGNSTSVTDLTKSFLFQFANGKNSKLGSYINKRLSKNYGLLSFGVHSVWAWICFVAALLSFAISKISEIKNFFIPNYVSVLPTWFKDAVKTVYNLSPVFLVIAIIFAVAGISLSSIAFSHWKTERKSDKEINDIFDTYQYIIRKSKPKKNRKQVVIIEDVDRVNSKKLVVEFLKELYRFQNLIKHNKNKFVFIVSVKPESSLKSENDENFVEEIYPKIFDVTISLKPIHFDDYDSLLRQLISLDTKKQQQIESLIGEKGIDKKLPDSFKWIIEGTNLTIRDLKERLNSALEIMVSLKNKDHQGNSSAKFAVCSAVSYLEHCFPKDFAKLISCEVELSNFVSDSYVTKKKKKDVKSEIKNDFNTNFEGYNFDDEFVDTICELTCDGYIDEDYRMYFYSYPKKSHIKTVHEKLLCDMLQLPYDEINMEKVDAAVENVFKKQEDNVVIDALNSVGNYPDVILYNQVFLKNAVDCSPRKVAYAIQRFIINNKLIDDDKAIEILKNVRSLNNSQIVEEIIRVSPSSFDEEGKNTLIRFRKLLICAFEEEILLFKRLFFTWTTISNEEVDLLNDSVLTVKLIDCELINDSNYDYILKLSSDTDFSYDSDAMQCAINVFDKSIESIDHQAIAPYLLDFMVNNRYITKRFFEVIAEETGNTIEKSSVANLLNLVSEQTIEAERLLETINDLGFTDTLSSNLVKSLLYKGLYYTPLLYYSNSNNLKEIDFTINVEQILGDLQRVMSFEEESFITIRKYIVSIDCVAPYISLYYAEYPFVKKDEYVNISDVQLSISTIDTEHIDEENAKYISEIINSKTYLRNDIIYLFKYLFDASVNKDCIKDTDTISILIENLDFNNAINLNQLTIDERETIIEYFKEETELNKFENAYHFMSRIKCLIPSLERVLQADHLNENLYLDLLFELNQFTETTMNWLLKRTPDCKLPDSICDELFSREEYYSFIPSVSLKDNQLVQNDDIDFEHYIDVYKDISEMFDIMSNNTWFLTKLMDSGKYTRLDIEHIRPLYKIEQIEEFFNYIFEEFNETEKTYYLNHYNKFRTESDSKKFQLLICKDANIELVNSQSLYYKIRQSLWESNPTHKQQFTKIWNMRWKKELSA